MSQPPTGDISSKRSLSPSPPSDNQAKRVKRESQSSDQDDDDESDEEGMFHNACVAATRDLTVLCMWIF